MRSWNLEWCGYVYCYSIPSYLIARGKEKGTPSLTSGRKVAPLSVVGWRNVVWGSSLYTFLTNIVAVTVFLISMLFPVNGAYLKPQSLPFVLPAGGRGETTDSVVLVRALNGGIPFLNYDKSLLGRELREMRQRVRYLDACFPFLNMVPKELFRHIF